MPVYEYAPVSAELAKIQAGDQRISKSMLEAMIDEGQSRKAPGFDESIKERRDYFDGRAREYIRAILQALYPKTWTQLERTLVEINVMRLIAEVDSAVYAELPHRYLVDDEDAQIDKDDPNARRFSRLVDDADLDVTMIEAELVLSIAHNVGLQIGHDPVRMTPRLTVWWPNQFLVLSHPRFPNDPNWFFGIVLDIEAPFGAPTQTRRGKTISWKQVYRRALLGYDDDTGRPRWGPWYTECLSTEGDRLNLVGDGPQLVPISTPFVLLQTGQPRGVFVDADRNLAKVVGVLNERWTDTIQLDRLQAHTQLVLSSNSTKPETITGGAGAVIKVRAEDTLTPIQLNPNIQANLSLIDALGQALAVSRQQAPEAYNRGDYLSGESRRQKDSPREKRRRRMQLRAKKNEERYLLPALIEAKNAWGPRADKITAGRPRMDPRRTVDYEDPNQKQQRLVVAVDKGWITHAQAAAEMNYYPSVDEARGAHVPDVLAGALAAAEEAQRASAAEREGAVVVEGEDTGAPPVDRPAEVATADVGAEAVQDTALNGAQVEALVAIIQGVSLGELTEATARPLILAAFPGITEAAVSQMLSGVDKKRAAAAAAAQNPADG